MLDAILAILAVLLGAGFVGIIALVGFGVILALILKGIVSLTRWIFENGKTKKERG